VNLIEISSSGLPAEEISELPVVATEVGVSYVNLYRSIGFVRPWLGYFGRQDSVCIGTCGFKGAPRSNRVEIAYFTFPGHEGRGYATLMARALIDKAWKTEADVIIAAQTLPNENASTTILRKLGFALVGIINHPEDGEVWEWKLSNRASPAPHDGA
jgi:ribosomal-protein-alanine N-acetyltransferase